MAAGDGVGVVIVAAGLSRRMAAVDKVFVPLAGQPLITYSLEAFHLAPQVESIVLVLSRQNIEVGQRLVVTKHWHKVKDICLGGQRRQASVSNGLDRLPDADWVVVHDGARPFVDQELIVRGLEAARQTGAAVAAVPVTDTIKVADAELLVTQTLRRDGLWAVQTPQVFSRQLLADAHRRVSEDVTDDASMVELIGAKVRIFMGSYQNIKVTTLQDLPIAEAILKARDPEPARPGA